MGGGLVTALALEDWHPDHSEQLSGSPELAAADLPFRGLSQGENLARPCPVMIVSLRRQGSLFRAEPFPRSHRGR